MTPVPLSVDTLTAPEILRAPHRERARFFDSIVANGLDRVARQLATIAEPAPGRRVFGVRQLVDGQPVDHSGEFFTFERAWIQPKQEAAIPVRFYRIPFGRFEKYSPFGTPEVVAGRLARYRDAGCRLFNLMPITADPDAGIAAVAEIERLLG